MTFEASTVTVASQYDLQIAEGVDFTKPELSTTLAVPIGTWTPTRLGKFVWRVRAVAPPAIRSTWTAPRTFNVILSAPDYRVIFGGSTRGLRAHRHSQMPLPRWKVRRWMLRANQ